MNKRSDYRFLDKEQISFRAIAENDKRYIIGYASVFNQRSKPIYENGKLFYEIIEPKA